MSHRCIPARILIVNPFGIGDVLFTTPLVRAVRRTFPGSFIGYLCNRRTEQVLRSNPHLNAVFIYEKDALVQLWRRSWWRGLTYLGELIRQIHQARFDYVIDLSLSERYSFILRLLGIARLVGFDYRQRGRFLSEKLSIDGFRDRHVVFYYRRLLRFIGIELVDDALELPVVAEDLAWAQAYLQQHHLMASRLLVGIVPGGGVSWGIGAPFRRWNAEGFAAVGDALVERYEARILLFGEEVDRPICSEVARLMRHPTINLVGQTDLGQFVALLSQAGLVICNDGGPLHLAVTQQVKTVSMFGPVDPYVYGPHASDMTLHRTVYREELPCRPCYHQFRLPPCPYERACLTTIQPDDVIALCIAVLEQQLKQLRERQVHG